MTTKQELMSSSTGEPTSEELEEFDRLLAELIEANGLLRQKIEALEALARKIGRPLPPLLAEIQRRAGEGRH